ncbi:hypothetical protein AOQ84DRAFT_376487 [Glonium stellatum]|uniref:Uncharacterized protein n=1 Tax=Glonium stellatum TaxID=574774 RepID=A0A8E2F193_9PEZI|nr:hypothetical protein AOQ84DRAFT_376487 [Glonium stellatum]
MHTSSTYSDSLTSYKASTATSHLEIGKKEGGSLILMVSKVTRGGIRLLLVAAAPGLGVFLAGWSCGRVRLQLASTNS